MAVDPIPPTLAAGLEALALDLPPHTPAQLAAYLTLLEKWNRVYNLTAIRQRNEMVTHHLLDSLIVLPYLADARSIVDVGSGAGLPAIPLAIARPTLTVTSVEALDKKAAFQRQAKIELALTNLEVICSRAETLTGRSFDVAISRAFASLSDFARLAGHLAPRLLAMKGKIPTANIPPRWHITTTQVLSVPGLPAARCLVILERE